MLPSVNKRNDEWYPRIYFILGPSCHPAPGFRGSKISQGPPSAPPLTPPAMKTLPSGKSVAVNWNGRGILRFGRDVHVGVAAERSICSAVCDVPGKSPPTI